MEKVNNEKIGVKIEKKNIVYIYSPGEIANFCLSIEECSFCKVFYRDNIDNLSLESYDAYIISIAIFLFGEEKANALLEKIYAFNKPVILIYDSRYNDNFNGILYLKSKFNISLERKDASIIDDAFEGYLPDSIDDYALSLFSTNGNGSAYIRNTKNCFVLRFGNISILHDVKLKFMERDKKRVKPLITLLLTLLEIPICTEKPKWIDEIKILDEIDIENSISSIDEEISQLEARRAKKKEKLEENNEYKKILYTSGDELVDVVKKILSEMLGSKIADLDVKKEDLSFDLENKKVLVEVKGVNTAIKREYVSQIQRHIEDDAQKNNVNDDEIPNRYKGLLIVNPYIKTPIKERIKKEFYSNTVKGDIEHYDICTVDTITLLGIFQKFKKNGNADLKKIVLNTSYNEPDFSIIH